MYLVGIFFQNPNLQELLTGYLQNDGLGRFRAATNHQFKLARLYSQFHVLIQKLKLFPSHRETDCLAFSWLEHNALEALKQFDRPRDRGAKQVVNIELYDFIASTFTCIGYFHRKGCRFISLNFVIT